MKTKKGCNFEYIDTNSVYSPTIDKDDNANIKQIVLSILIKLNIIKCIFSEVK